jgi:glycosyltransferase involved in cell wall biosynthesis
VFIVANNVEEMGGAIRFAHTLGRLLSERGHRVRLIGIVPPPERYPYGDDLPYSMDVVHTRHPPSTLRREGLAGLDPRILGRRIVRASMQRAGARRLSRLLAAGRPGGVVICCQVFAMEWVRLANTRGMHVIGMSHESYSATRASSRYERVLRFYRDVDRLLLLTQADSDRWALQGFTNVAAMPNALGVHASSLSTLDQNVVVSLGRFSPEKGFDLLVDAWARVAPRHPDWTLVLYGDGPAEPAIRAQVEQLGLSSSVRFMGRTHDVGAALQAASVYALSSRHEGMPVALMEAMEYGLPSVAFDVSPGVREVLEDGINGLVVAPGNTIHFAEMLDRLMSDSELRRSFGAAAHDSVQRFAPDRVTDQWEDELALLDR